MAATTIERSGGVTIALAGMVAMAVPMMQLDAGVSIADGGWLASANYAGTLLGAVCAALVSVPAAPAVRGGMLVIGLTTLGMAVAGSLLPWILLHALAGFATAWVLVFASAWSLARLAPWRRPALNSTVFAGHGVGIAGAGLVCFALMRVLPVIRPGLGAIIASALRARRLRRAARGQRDRPARRRAEWTGMSDGLRPARSKMSGNIHCSKRCTEIAEGPVPLHLAHHTVTAEQAGRGAAGVRRPGHHRHTTLGHGATGCPTPGRRTHVPEHLARLELTRGVTTDYAPAVMRLANKVAIVTGGASGIGFAYARRFLAEGARVVIADVTDPVAAAEKLDAAGHALGVRTDVSDAASVRTMVEVAVGRFGRVDVLINNAAVFAALKPQPFDAISEDEWDRVMAVNVKGIWNCVRAVVPLMRAQGGGRIVNVASAIVAKGTAMLLHYVTSKGAVVAMTRALARELGPDGITVNAVAPGLILSDGVQANPDITGFQSAAVMQARSLRRDAFPEDVEGTVVFLASDDSAFMSGQTLIVDGGSVFSTL